MDGGRRLLRPLKEVMAAFEPSFPAYAGAAGELAVEAGRTYARSGQRNRASLAASLLQIASAPGIGLFLALFFLGATGLYGSVLGGQYTAFIKADGTLPDVFARMLGFAIESVTINGAHELSQHEILDAAGIDPTKSLLFLDVAKLRARLKALPLVKDASVSKLFPHRLLIDIDERKPIALWQKDGKVTVIASDGIPIDTLHDQRFLTLPLAVGIGANMHIGDFLALLNAAGELRGRIEAGIFVAQRRWTLKMKNGVEVALPEKGAVAALAELIRLERDYRVLDKDVVALDLRIPGRLIATLPPEIAEARLAVLAHQAKKGGAR